MATLAVPFWEVLTGPLQSATVAVSGVLVRFTGIPANLSGTRISLQWGTIEVAESCAGLNYFMSAFTIAVIYARFTLKNLAPQVGAIAFALALSVLSNWGRVFGLIVIGERSRMQSPLMRDHGTYGWVIFSVTMVLFFLLTKRFELWDARTSLRTVLPERLSADPPSDTDSSEKESSAHFYWTTVAPISSFALVGPFLLLIGSIVPPQSGTDLRLHGPQWPTTWQKVGGTSIRMNAGELPPIDSSVWAPRFSRPSSHIVETWSGDSTTIQLNRLAFDRHLGAGELISGSNRIADVDATMSERDVGPLDSDLRIVRESLVRTPTGFRLVWYWYVVADIETASPGKAKLLELWRFISRGTASELVAVSAACGPADCQRATQSLFLVTTGRAMPVSAAK
jgi:exosortase/archaeosortase family protein